VRAVRVKRKKEIGVFFFTAKLKGAKFFTAFVMKDEVLRDSTGKISGLNTDDKIPC